MTGVASPAAPSAPSSDWSPASTPPAPPGPKDRSPRPATATPAGCSSKPPGTTAPATSPARPSAIAGTSPHQPHEPAATWETAACTPAGSSTSTARRRPPWPTPPSPASSPAGAGRWPCSRSNPPEPLRQPPSLMAARGANPRSYYEQPPITAPRSSLDTRNTPAERPSCGTQPAHISLTTRRQRHADQRPRRRRRGARLDQSRRAPHPAS